MNSQYSFRNGWLQVRQGDIRVVRKKLYHALGITTAVAFCNRLNGKVEPRVSEHESIERIFAEHGITEVWGDTPDATTKVEDFNNLTA